MQQLGPVDEVADRIVRRPKESNRLRVGEPSGGVNLEDGGALIFEVSDDLAGFMLVEDMPRVQSRAIRPQTTQLNNRDESESADEYQVATLDNSPSNPEPMDIPAIHGLARAHHAFTTNVQSLLPAIRAIVGSLALRSQILIAGLTLGIETDPEDEIDKVVLHVKCDASPAQTFAFWDSLGVELQLWLDRLPRGEARVFLDDLGLRVYWSPPLRKP